MPEAATTAQITVKYLNPQQPGKKNASIKDNDGQLYFVSPDMFSQFEQGGQYSIQYKTSEFKGVKYRHIEKVDKAAGASSAPAPGPNIHNSMTKAAYGKVDMETAERIFVCGAMNAMLSNQNVLPFALVPHDLIQRVNMLRETWRATLGNPQQDAELNDEIPF
jgi:hypothetical protein